MYPDNLRPPGRSTGAWSRRDLLRTGIGAAATGTLFLAGCGPDNSGGGADESGGAAVELPPEISGAAYPKDYVGPRVRKISSIADRSKAFTVVVNQDTAVVGDWNKNEFSQWLEEQTGVKINYLTVNTAGEDMTKINAMISAGDLPDAFLSIPFSPDQIALYGQQGVFRPLDDLVQSYAPRVQELYAGYPDAKTLAKAPDGKIYAAYGLNDCYHCRASDTRTWVNSEFLETLGLKAPRTTEEFRTMLKAMVDQDVNGHGDLVALACPTAAPQNDQIDRFFMNSFLYNPGEPWLRLTDGRVDFVANKPEWREGLRFLRSLYDDGTLTPQLFTTTRESLQRLDDAKDHFRIGVLRHSGPEKVIDVGSNAADARWRSYQPLLPLEGPAGVRATPWMYYRGIVENSFVITSKCEDPSTLMKWADVQLDLEVTLRAYAGQQEKNWYLCKKGAQSILGQQALWNAKTWPAPVGTSWNQNSLMFRSNGFRLGQEINPDNPTYEANLYRATTQYEPLQQPKEWELPPVILNPDVAGMVVDTAVSLSNLVKQSIAEFSTAKLDVNDDAVWTTYVDKINSMGLDPYLQAHQQAYDNRAG